jgi:phenylacetate-CoA ligase
MIFSPEIEQMPRPKLRALQDERLHKLVHYVYDKVPFYRKHFEQLGLKPDAIKGIGDLHRLPFTYKNDLRDHYPFGLFAMPVSQMGRIHCSSGTTGKPTVVGYSKGDLKTFADVNARSLAAAGAKPGMMLHNAYGYGLFTGGLGLHAGAERLGMTVVPVSGGMTERQLMLLQDFGPDVICCTPSYAQTLSEEVNKRGLDLPKLKYAVLGAEPWTEAIRTTVEKGLQVKASNIYGLSEIIGPGVSQEAVEERGTGSHVWEDHFFPEIVDPDTGEPLPEGEDGVLVFTTLTKEAFPVLRYWTNDICSLYVDPDSQRTHIKMGPIRGRADDMLIIRGVNLFHTQVESLIADIPELLPHYQLVVTREGAMDEVAVKVEVSEEFWRQGEQLPGLQQLFRKKIKDNIGLTMKVSLHEFGSIPRSAGGKLSRILDKR